LKKESRGLLPHNGGWKGLNTGSGPGGEQMSKEKGLEGGVAKLAIEVTF